MCGNERRASGRRAGAASGDGGAGEGAASGAGGAWDGAGGAHPATVSRGSTVQRVKFPNRMNSLFNQEIEEANTEVFSREYETGLGPYVASYSNSDRTWVPTLGFLRMVDGSTSTRQFKWTLNERGDLAVISPTLKHAAASGGGDVWTAGHGWLLEPPGPSGRRRVKLNNDTGHYWATEPSLQRARAAWESRGYDVECVPMRDLRAALIF